MNTITQAALALGQSSILRFLGIFLLVVLIFATTPDSASAVTIQGTTPPSPSRTNEALVTPAPLEKFLEKTQRSYTKALAKTQQAITDLPQQLAQISTTTDINLKKQLKEVIEDKQDDLENATDKFDDLAEKLQSLGQKLTRTQDPNQASLQTKVESAQLALSQLAQSLNTLADSTEIAKKNATTEIQTQIEQQIQSVQKALEQADQAVLNFQLSVI